jgi:2-oxoglutarate dehydrogenase E2 component (dihydrolipoamide succinyltransferase)
LNNNSDVVILFNITHTFIMPVVEIKVPSPGESITEVQIANWLRSDGDYVEKDEEIAEIDSDKATLTIAAEESGTLNIKIPAGETVSVGTIVATIDTSVAKPPTSVKPEVKPAEPVQKTVPVMPRELHHLPQLN